MKIKNILITALSACSFMTAGIISTPTASAAVEITVPSGEIDPETAEFISSLVANMFGKLPQLTPAQLGNIKNQAQSGDTDAQFFLGFLHICGIYVEHDVQKGLTLLVNAAKKGNTEAKSVLGGLYVSGYFGEEYAEQGLKLVEEAAAAGAPGARYSLCMIYLSEGKYEEADALYEQLMASNDPRLQDMISVVSESFLQTAEQGDPMAQMTVAFMHLFGIFGFEEDGAKAFKWIKRAADAGQPYAIFALGGFYEEGIGTPVNKEKALEYYKKAADAGVPDAQEAYDALKNAQ